MSLPKGEKRGMCLDDDLHDDDRRRGGGVRGEAHFGVVNPAPSEGAVPGKLGLLALDHKELLDDPANSLHNVAEWPQDSPTLEAHGHRRQVNL